MDTLDLGLNDTLAHARGERSRPRWDVPTPQALKALRQRLEMSQAQFALVYGLNLDSLKSWESGRAVPEQPNCQLLGLIAYDPTRAADYFREVETHQDLARNREPGPALNYDT